MQSRLGRPNSGSRRRIPLHHGGCYVLCHSMMELTLESTKALWERVLIVLTVNADSCHWAHTKLLFAVQVPIGSAPSFQMHLPDLVCGKRAPWVRLILR